MSSVEDSHPPCQQLPKNPGIEYSDSLGFLEITMREKIWKLVQSVLISVNTNAGAAILGAGVTYFFTRGVREDELFVPLLATDTHGFPRIKT